MKCRLPSSTVILEIPVNDRAEPSIHSSAAGIQIDFKDQHPQNALAPIRRNSDPESKLNEETDLHLKKHFPHRISTEDGIQTDVNNEHDKNAATPIRFNLEPDSKCNEEREKQPLKQLVQSSSTD
jgi:hypothetical protein